MKRSISLWFILSLAITLSACTTFREVRETRKNLAKIELGMSKGEVVTIVGLPYDSEIFVSEDGQSWEVLKYQTSHDLGGPILNSDTRPICFQEEQVIGWGHNFYSNMKKNVKFLYERK